MVSRVVQKTVQSTLKLMSLFHAFISDTIPYRKKENQITYALFSSISNTIEVQGEEIAFPRTLTYCVRRNYLISYSLCVWTIILTDMVINNICEGIKIPGIITHSNEIKKDWKRRKRKTGRPQTTPKSNCLKFASFRHPLTTVKPSSVSPSSERILTPYSLFTLSTTATSPQRPLSRSALSPRWPYV